MTTYKEWLRNKFGRVVPYTYTTCIFDEDGNALPNILEGLLTPEGLEERLLDYVNHTEKGAINGVAELDEFGKVPSSQLPSFVDDVLEYSTYNDFPSPGENGKIYVDLSTNKTYRWSGSTYVLLNEGVVLGETSSTAYRGDRGKIAYDHSQTTTGNPHNVTKANVGLGNVDNTSDATKPLSQAVITALEGKANVGATMNPTSHAYSTNIYGVGTDTLFGHLMLGDIVTPAEPPVIGFAGKAAPWYHTHEVAPIAAHAVNDDIYGLGTTGLYGHVKLGPVATPVSQGVGVAAAAVHTHLGHGLKATTQASGLYVANVPTLMSMSLNDTNLVTTTGGISVNLSTHAASLNPQPVKVQLEMNVDVGPNDTYTTGALLVAMTKDDSRIYDVWHTLEICALKTFSGNIPIVIQNSNYTASTNASYGSFKLNNKNTYSTGRMSWQNNNKWTICWIPISLSGTITVPDTVTIRFKYHNPTYNSGSAYMVGEPHLHVIVE